MSILNIECGKTVDASVAQIDSSSSGTSSRMDRKPPEGYYLFTRCPAAKDYIPIGLIVPVEVDISTVNDLLAAKQRLLSSGNIYRCNKYKTEECPLF